MSETTTETNKTELNALKQAHDYYATAVQIFKQRVQFYHEEFSSVMNMVAFFDALREQTLQAIYKIEPPKKETTKPLEMDLTHVKAEETKQAELN